MNNQYLKKPNGAPYAVIRTDTNGVQRIYTIGGAYRGSYRPTTNATYHPNGSLVGWGNLLGTLV